MKQNLFESLKHRKDSVRNLICKAEEFGWISKKLSEEYQKKLNGDTLTIGVIGQMKWFSYVCRPVSP